MGGGRPRGPARRARARRLVLYVTAPWGVTDQPDFHNAVVAADVPADRDPATGAIELLGELKTLERLAGRRRADGGARASSTSTCWSSVGTGSQSTGRRARARTTLGRPEQGGAPPRGPASGRSGSGCSCWRRLPTSHRGWCRRAGARRSRPDGDGGGRPNADAVRRIARWRADPGEWVREPASG